MGVGNFERAVELHGKLFRRDHLADLAGLGNHGFLESRPDDREFRFIRTEYRRVADAVNGGQRNLETRIARHLAVALHRLEDRIGILRVLRIAQAPPGHVETHLVDAGAQPEPPDIVEAGRNQAFLSWRGVRPVHGLERPVPVEDLKRHAQDPEAPVEHLPVGNRVRGGRRACRRPGAAPFRPIRRAHCPRAAAFRLSLHLFLDLWIQPDAGALPLDSPVPRGTVPLRAADRAWNPHCPRINRIYFSAFSTMPIVRGWLTTKRSGLLKEPVAVAATAHPGPLVPDIVGRRGPLPNRSRF